MCAVTNAVFYVTVCVISEPISSVKCILLSFFIADTIPSHFYAIIFRVCFVFCSCHLLWFHQLLNLLGITHSCFGVFLIENPAVLWLGLKHFLPSVEVSVEFHCCWLALCCQGTPPRATRNAGEQVNCKAFCGGAGCSLKLRALLLSFFLSCLLGRVAEEQFMYPVIAGTVIQQNQTRQGEIFTLFPAVSLKNAQTFPVETLIIQVQKPAVSTGQITL